MALRCRETDLGTKPAFRLQFGTVSSEMLLQVPTVGSVCMAGVIIPASSRCSILSRFEGE